MDLEELHLTTEESLQKLKSLLESGYGDYNEWFDIISKSNYTMIHSLISLSTKVQSTQDRTLSIHAACCLVHIGNLVKNLWLSLLLNTLDQNLFWSSCNTLVATGKRILLSSPPRLVSHSSNDEEEQDENSFNSLVWLTLLRQIFCLKLTVGYDTHNEDGLNGRILCYCNEFIDLVPCISTELFEHLIKLISALNYQCRNTCPKSIGWRCEEDCFSTTEIAKVISDKANTELGSNLYEGILHNFNEACYSPSFSDDDIADVEMILTLCTDLIKVRSANEDCIIPCYFYTNDLKVILEIILREFRNMPFDIIDNVAKPCVQIIRVLYIKMFCAIINQPKENISNSDIIYSCNQIAAGLATTVCVDSDKAFGSDSILWADFAVKTHSEKDL